MHQPLVAGGDGIGVDRESRAVDGSHDDVLDAVDRQQPLRPDVEAARVAHRERRAADVDVRRQLGDRLRRGAGDRDRVGQPARVDDGRVLAEAVHPGDPVRERRPGHAVSRGAERVAHHVHPLPEILVERHPEVLLRVATAVGGEGQDDADHRHAQQQQRGEHLEDREAGPCSAHGPTARRPSAAAPCG